MARKNASASTEVNDLRRQMNHLSEQTTPLLGATGQQVGDAAAAAAGVAQSRAAELADVVRRQPLPALAIGMAGAYVLGRIIGAMRR